MRSKFIKANSHYEARSESIQFCYLESDSTVNAFATDHDFQLTDGSVLRGPSVVVCGGMAAAARLVGASMAIYLQKQLSGDLRWAFHDIGRFLVQSKGRLTAAELGMVFSFSMNDRLLQMVRENQETFSRDMQAVCHSILVHTIAHEVGHIALGHTLSQPTSEEISRNQEREADSFACSAISGGANREILFIGQVMVNALFSWMHKAGGNPAVTSHPHPQDRFHNAFVSNPTAARETHERFGLDYARFKDMLPV